MKNTVRAHRNGATRRTAPQVQPPKSCRSLGPEFQLPKDAPTPLCLALVDRENQELRCKIPLSEDEFKNLWMLMVGELTKLPAEFAKQVKPADVFAGWLRGVLRNSSILNEFESAKAQNYALHMLLEQALNRNDGGGNYGEEIQFGISNLIMQTHDRMDKVYDSFHRQSKEVVS